MNYEMECSKPRGCVPKMTWREVVSKMLEVCRQQMWQIHLCVPFARHGLVSMEKMYQNYCALYLCCRLSCLWNT